MSQVSENPFENSDTNKRYFTYDYYLRKTFGSKCAKITLDAGFSCPNIDGTKSFGGCIYCSGGSKSRNANSLVPLREQYENQKKEILKKWQTDKFIPYLQSYTNTHTSPENLQKILDEVSSFDGCVMVDIATRADCLEDEKIQIIKELSDKIPVTVELGLQTTNDKTAEAINRAHTYADFTDGFMRLRNGAPKVKIAVHLIDGLPGESEADMLKSAVDLSKLCPDVVKIHLLHVIKGTKMEKMFLDGNYVPMEKSDYVSIVCNQIEVFSPDTVIERVTGDGLKETLVAPLWSIRKTEVINEIDKELFRRNSYQGIKYRK